MITSIDAVCMCFFSAIGGVMFGSIFLEDIIRYIILKTTFTNKTACVLNGKAEMERIEKLCKSPKFKKELNQVLDLIREDAKKNLRRIEIAHIPECEIDKQIRYILKQRGFDTCFIERANTLEISW